MELTLELKGERGTSGFIHFGRQMCANLSAGQAAQFDVEAWDSGELALAAISVTGAAGMGPAAGAPRWHCQQLDVTDPLAEQVSWEGRTRAVKTALARCVA